MKKSLNLNLVKMDTANLDNVTGQYWEYFVSGQTLKQYLKIPRSSAVTPFGWFRNTESERRALRQFRMQQKSSLINSRIELYICAACGDIGCGSVTAQVKDFGNIIVWSEFADAGNEEEVGEIYDVDPIEFDRTNYFQAFACLP